MNNLKNVFAYIEELSKADWNYEFSDDHNCWACGREKMIALYVASNFSSLHTKIWETFSSWARCEISLTSRDAIVNELLETNNV